MGADIWPAVAAAQVKLPIDRVFPLENISDACAHMRANAYPGKIVAAI
jgi:NADPH2:quinone reductase